MNHDITLYRYTYDSSKVFTEATWIESSLDHFVREPSDTDLTFTMFVISVFRNHVRDATIVPLDQARETTISPLSTRKPNSLAKRCKDQNHAHLTRSVYICLDCYEQFQFRDRNYFCFECRDVHSLTWAELTNHGREFHPAKEYTRM